MAERVGNCVCGQTFPIPFKRGRPPVRCDGCREAYSNGTLRDRLASLGIDPDVVLRKRINSGLSPTLRDAEILAQSEDETEIVDEINKSKARVANLELMLKANGSHISQHKDKW